MEQTETEKEEKTTPVKISNDKLQSDFKKRLEFFEQMVKDGGLEMSPESGALVAALKNEMIRKALTPQKPPKRESPKLKLSQRLSSPHIPKMIVSNKSPPTSPGRTSKFVRTKSEHKLQGELQKAIGKKEKEKKRKK